MGATGTPDNREALTKYTVEIRVTVRATDRLAAEEHVRGWIADGFNRMKIDGVVFGHVSVPMARGRNDEDAD